MQCTNCGNTLSPNAAFCNNCGRKVEPPAAATQFAGAGQTMQAPPPSGPGPMGAPPAGPGAPGGYQSPPTQAVGTPPYGTPPPSAPGYGAGAPPYAGYPGGPAAGPAAGAPPYAQQPGAPQRYAGPGPGPGAGPGYGPGGYGAGMARRGGGSVDFAPTLNRLTRLLRFDTTVFREAYQDATAMIPGVVVAAVSILLLALGTWLWAQFKFGDTGFDSGRFVVRSVIVGTITGTAAWAAWVAIAALVLQQMFRRQVTIPALFGPMGLAALPFAIGLLAVIDFLYLVFAISAIAGAAMLSQAALQDSTDSTGGEAFIANLAGFVVFAVVLMLLGRSDSNLAPGIWGFNWYSIF